MKIDLYDLITLDNNKKYVVGSIINHNNIDYYLLCDELNPKQYMFCFLKDNKLVKVKEDNLYQILSLKITKDLLK
jgi:hypothetical protein